MVEDWNLFSSDREQIKKMLILTIFASQIPRILACILKQENKIKYILLHIKKKGSFMSLFEYNNHICMKNEQL